MGKVIDFIKDKYQNIKPTKIIKKDEYYKISAIIKKEKINQNTGKKYFIKEKDVLEIKGDE